MEIVKHLNDSSGCMHINMRPMCACVYVYTIHRLYLKMLCEVQFQYTYINWSNR